MQHVAQGLASLGRGGDTQLVHMTPGEVHGLQALAMSHGGSLTINPETGLPEAGFLRNILPMALGAGAMMIPGLQSVGAGWLAAGFGGLSALASGSFKQGLSDGLGFFGGANLASGLTDMGASEIEKAKIASYDPLKNPSYFDSIGTGTPPPPELPQGMLRAGMDAAPNALTNVGSGGSDVLNLGQNAKQFTGALGNEDLFTRGTADSAALTGPPAPPADPSLLDKATRGVQQLGTGQGFKDLYGKVGFGGTALLAAPIATELMKQPTLANNAAALPSKGNIRPYQYTAGQVDPEAQRQIAQFGFSKVPYFSGQGYAAQPVYAAAAGGQVPQPSLPLDLSQNYPGSNITKSSYATLPSTQPQEIMDGYGPKINPFTGAEGMAEGGMASYDLGGSVKSLFIGDMKGSGEGLGGGFRDLVGRLNSQGAFGNPQDEAMQEAQQYTYNPEDQQYTQMAAGGIASLPEYAAGGKLLRGPGDGMSDDIPAVIKGKTPQRAALADGEFVVPADVVSHLGNGSTDAGAKRLYSMMDRVRKARTGNPKQGKQITAERFMPA